MDKMRTINKTYRTGTTMKTLTVTQARDQLADAVARVAYTGERTRLTKHGKTVAVLVSPADAELLALLEDRADLDAVRKSLKEVARKGARPWADVKADLGL